MVTSESNRAQVSTTSPFERQAQTPQPREESVAGQPQAEELAPVSIHDPFWFMSLVVAGATTASMCALSALVLAILGLSGVLSMYMLPVAGIVLGLAFAALGTVGTAWQRMFPFPEDEAARHRTVFFSGIAAVLIAGLAAVVLGILSFAFLGDARFGAGTVIVLGLGLLWHSGVVRRVGHFTDHVIYHGAEGQRPGGPFAINALSLAPVRDFVVGLGGVILGILAMINVAPVVLEFVALLIIGGALTATASTICGASRTALRGVCAKS